MLNDVLHPLKYTGLVAGVYEFIHNHVESATKWHWQTT